ncbi:MAG: hypothetical protein ABW252_09640 [Polyangiales bacterium]
MAERTNLRRSALALVVAVVGLAGCLVDKGRCGPNQENNAVGNCVCREGFVPGPDLVCVACGVNEISLGDKCVCRAGHARDMSQLCQPVTAEVGKPCLTDADCPAGGPYCHRPEEGDPYCTITGCTQLLECPGGYGCDLKSSPTFCARAPTGLFSECKTQADCAGKEASYCENTVSNLCVVQGCLADGDCFTGLECCLLGAFGLPNLCVAEGVCPVE